MTFNPDDYIGAMFRFKEVGPFTDKQWWYTIVGYITRMAGPAEKMCIVKSYSVLPEGKSYAKKVDFDSFEFWLEKDAIEFHKSFYLKKFYAKINSK